ncbi:MAG: MarR family transcriptional regulator [Pseudomonadota bacterium]
MCSNKQQDHTPEDLIVLCRRLYSAIDKMDHRAATLVKVSRNDLRCLNLVSEGPVKPSVIAGELGLTSGAVTTLLDRLERLDLVQREPDPDDRRGVIVRATDNLFRTLGPLYRSVADELVRIGKTYTKSELRDSIRYLSDAVGAYETTADRSS